MTVSSPKKFPRFQKGEGPEDDEIPTCGKFMDLPDDICWFCYGDSIYVRTDWAKPGTPNPLVASCSPKGQ